MTQKSEFYVKLHKWADNIENILTEWSHESVEEHYGVDDIEDLNESQIQELRDWVELNSESGYDYVTIGFTNIINYWESENEHD